MTGHSNKQKGAALIVSMIMLIVLTLIGLTAMGTSSLQERMAGNSRDLSLAFQAAEAALRDAETYYDTTVVSLGSAFSGDNTGLYPQNSLPDPFDSGTWANSLVFSGTVDNVAEQPRYIIELIGPISAGAASEELNIGGYGESSGGGNLTAVRVTSRGVGSTPDTAVVLQTYFASVN